MEFFYEWGEGEGSVRTNREMADIYKKWSFKLSFHVQEGHSNKFWGIWDDIWEANSRDQEIWNQKLNAALSVLPHFEVISPTKLQPDTIFPLPSPIFQYHRFFQLVIAYPVIEGFYLSFCRAQFNQSSFTHFLVDFKTLPNALRTQVLTSSSVCLVG